MHRRWHRAPDRPGVYPVRVWVVLQLPAVRRWPAAPVPCRPGGWY